MRINKKALMNLKLLFLAFSGFVGLYANGQTNPRNPIVTGVKGGLNVSNISAGSKSQNFKPSFNFGGFVEFPLSYYKQFAIQFELQYSGQGYNGKEIEKKEPGTGNVIEKNKLDNVGLHYLNVPIVIKYYVSDNFAIEVGPQIGFLMGANGTFDLYKYNEARNYVVENSSNLVNELDKNGYGNNNYKDFYDTLDYGVTFGISYNFESGVFLSGRYYLGLKDVYKADNQYSKLSVPKDAPQALVDEVARINKELGLEDVKNSVIQLSVGYRF